MSGRASQELDAEFVTFVELRAGRHLHAAVLLTGDWHAAEDLIQTFAPLVRDLVRSGVRLRFASIP